MKVDGSLAGSSGGGTGGGADSAGYTPGSGGRIGAGGALGSGGVTGADAPAPPDGPSFGADAEVRPDDAASDSAALTPGQFVATGDMKEARASHTATLLMTGKVLVVGGEALQGGSRYSINSTELYDPGTGTFAASGTMYKSRVFHSATLLTSGSVLVVGGFYDGSALSTAEEYDPATGEFSRSVLNMTVARQWHTAMLLPNGKVLIAGGQFTQPASIERLSSAELFDPATQSFSATGSMAVPRLQFTATLLRNGKVLVAGGINGTDNPATSELYDPATGSFVATGTMITPRASHVATLLSDGRVLFAGGTESYGLGNTPLASAELYDPTTGLFTATGSMGSSRTQPSATLLPNGKVLVAGEDGIAGQTAEVYDPGSGTFSITASMISQRGGHTATLLPDSRVLLAGGAFFSTRAPGYIFLSSAELYSF